MNKFWRLFLMVPNATAMLGVSTHAAKKVVDAIYAGMSIWTIVSLVLAGGGVGLIAVGLVKSISKKLGRSAAIAW